MIPIYSTTVLYDTMMEAKEWMPPINATAWYGKVEAV